MSIAYFFTISTWLCLRLTQKNLRNCHSSVFLFFSSRHFSGGNTENFSANVLILFINKMCDQDLIHSLDTPKHIFLKNCFWSYERMAHDRLTHINQHSKYPKKHRKVPELIARNLETSYANRSIATQGEIKLINKKVWRKRKEKIFKIEKLITGPCEAI